MEKFEEMSISAQTTILDLNEDCLYHLSTFLHGFDVVNLRSACFGRLHNIVVKRLAITRKEFSKKRDQYDRLLDSDGPSIQYLFLSDILEKFTNNILLKTPNVSQLEVNDSTFNADSVPEKLSSLALFNMALQRGIEMQQIFRKVNPTLRTLKLSHAGFLFAEFDVLVHGLPSNYYYGLQELTNITRFECYYVWATAELIDFMRKNQEHMEHVQLMIQIQNELFPCLMALIRGMGKLKSLTLGGLCEDLSVVLGSLPALEELICVNVLDPVRILRELDGSCLKMLKMIFLRVKEEHVEAVSRFPQLQRLYITGGKWNVDQLQRVILRLPKLTMIALEHKLDPVSEQRLKAFLRRNSRNVELTYVDY